MGKVSGSVKSSHATVPAGNSNFPRRSFADSASHHEARYDLSCASLCRWPKSQVRRLLLVNPQFPVIKSNRGLLFKSSTISKSEDDPSGVRPLLTQRLWPFVESEGGDISFTSLRFESQKHPPGTSAFHPRAPDPSGACAFERATKPRCFSFSYFHPANSLSLPDPLRFTNHSKWFQE